MRELEARIEVLEDFIIHDPDSGKLMLDRREAYLAAHVAALKEEAERNRQTFKPLTAEQIETWKAGYMAALPRLYAVILKSALARASKEK